MQAHYAIEVGVEMGVAEETEIVVELAFGNQRRAEPLDRHVGERVETVEYDTVTLAEDAFVIGLKRGLRRRQRRTLRIVDQVDGKARAVAAVTQGVKPLQAADRA